VCVSHEATLQSSVMSTMSFFLSNAAAGEGSSSKSARTTFSQREANSCTASDCMDLEEV
jgi:hypothetical protein